MKTQKQKRNHWVPQVYLRTFAADTERKRIWTFSKEEGDPALRPIRSVAMRFYLYTPPSPQGRDYSFEAKLSSLEQWFGGPVWKALCSDYVDLCDPIVRKFLSLLVAVMYLRNPAQLAMMRDLHRNLVEFYSRLPEWPESVEINGKAYEFDASDWENFRNADEDQIKRMWLKHVGSAVFLAEIMIKMRWMIMVSDTPAFITTDNPVSVLHPSLRFRGLKHPETMLVFPISPTRVLFLDNRHTEPDGQYYPVKDGAPALNSQLWRNALELMLSPRHPDEISREMLDDAARHGFAA